MAYLISICVLCYIILTFGKQSIAFQKKHLCSPCSPKQKAGGALAPCRPPLRRPCSSQSFPTIYSINRRGIQLGAVFTSNIKLKVFLISGRSLWYAPHLALLSNQTLPYTIKQGSGTYGSQARCRSLNDCMWLSG